MGSFARTYETTEKSAPGGRRSRPQVNHERKMANANAIKHVALIASAAEEAPKSMAEHNHKQRQWWDRQIEREREKAQISARNSHVYEAGNCRQNHVDMTALPAFALGRGALDRQRELAGDPGRRAK